MSNLNSKNGILQAEYWYFTVYILNTSHNFRVILQVSASVYVCGGGGGGFPTNCFFEGTVCNFAFGSGVWGKVWKIMFSSVDPPPPSF